MTKHYSRQVGFSFWLLGLLLFSSAAPSFAQVFRPEGVHMPGSWNGYGNYPNPATHFNLRGQQTDNGAPYAVQNAGGFKEVFGPLGGSPSRYQSTLLAGTDVPAGAQNFKFTSGPSGNPWSNQWTRSSVTMNALETYNYCSGCNPANTNINLTSGQYYTVNWRAQYSTTSGIFMVTSGAPVDIANVVQGTVNTNTAVDLDITLSAAKSAEENVFVRWTTNAFTSSALVQASGTGTAYTASIPGQPNGTIVNYYVFTSTKTQAQIEADFGNVDMYTLRFKNAGGTNPYSYTVSSANSTVTFTVDMNNEYVGGGVFLAGSWNSFSPTAIPMTETSAGSGIYTADVVLPQGAAVTYKFVNGSNFETIANGSPCINGSGNRTLTVANAATDNVPSTCFRQCGTCPPKNNVIFRVNMANVTVDPSGVFIAGSFNGFTNLAMTQVGTTPVYQVTIPLAEGYNYTYKFKNGTNGWEGNLGAPCGNGSDRTLTGPTTPTTLGTVCFNQCDNCTVLRNVVFTVDLGIATPSPNGVHVAGAFQTPQWQPNTTQMTRIGTTSRYTYTATIAEGVTFQYKFINGNDWPFAENVPGGCNVSGNRQFTVPTGGTGNVVIPTVCLGQCTACPTPTQVTFTVDLGSTPVSPNGVHVAGSFQSPAWQPNTTQMTRIGTTSRYTVTVPVISSNIQYKFINGNDWPFAESVPGNCNTFSNRFYNGISGASLTIPTVCYERCIACDAANTWTGSNDNNYNNGDNWTAGVVPSGCSEIVQINNVATKPALSGGTATVGSLSFQSGASMSIAPGATLSVCGNITGAGAITGQGNLVINGTGTQTWSTRAAFQNVTVTKASGTWNVTGGPLTVAGTLSLGSASTAVNVSNNALVLASSNAGTGRLGEVPAGASITGSLTLERKLPSVSGWYFVTAPFTAGTTFAQWSELPARVAPANNANVLQYTESDSSSVKDATGRTLFSTGWRPVASLGTAIQPGAAKGYRVFQNAAFVSGGSKLSVSGTPNIGNVSAPFTFTPSQYDGGGWNLLGNPYASEVDWNNVVFDPTNASAPSGNAINVYNGANKQYASYTALTPTTGTATNGGSRFIASSQSFFIKATAAGSITFKEAHKTATSGNTFMRTQEPENTLHLTVSGNNASDEVAVVFAAGASRGTDRFDAVKMDGEALNLAVVPAAGLKHAISVLPMMTGREELPLSLETSAVGAYALTANGLSGFAAGTRFFIQDSYTGTLTEVTEGGSYAFLVSADPASRGTHRLALVVQPASATSTVKAYFQPQISAWPVPASAKEGKLNVRVARLGAGQGMITMTDAMGRVVTTQAAALAQDGTTVEVSLSGLAKGVYTLKASGSEASVTKQIVVE